MAVDFSISDEFSDDDATAIEEEAESVFGDRIRVHTPRKKGLGFDVENPTPIAGLVIGIIMLCFRLRDEIKARKQQKEWDGPRLREVIDTEMVRLGLPTYEIVEVTDFFELQRDEGNPCSIHARSGDNEHTIRVFRNGDSYSIRQLDA